jgi:uncharacterized SAM-binding protein YcdF (DUF218 family)
MNGQRLLRFLGCGGIVGFLLATYTPLPNLLARWAGVSPQLAPAEAVVVLAGSVHATGVLSDDSLRRAVHGMVLYRRGLAPLLVFSGPPNEEGIVEAEVRAEMARELGIPSTAIVTETTARTTREEATRMAALLLPRGMRAILLVTDLDHMRRSQQLFQKAGFTVRPAPVDDLSQTDSSEGRLRLMRRILQEALARLYYRLAGYL